jgi:type IV pilus assembly protein PilN
MARINLLPWREWERERRKRQFLGNLAGTFVLGAVLVLAGGWYLDGRIENQNDRNRFLRAEIDVLDQQIAEIADLRKKREELLARIRVILELQTNRPIIVRVFDELVRTLSPGLHFTNLKLQGNLLTLDAQAESNNRISSLMRNLDGSELFAAPNLKSIKEDPKNEQYGAQASVFNLTFTQTNPNATEADAEVAAAPLAGANNQARIE